MEWPTYLDDHGQKIPVHACWDCNIRPHQTELICIYCIECEQKRIGELGLETPNWGRQYDKGNREFRPQVSKQQKIMEETMDNLF